jgi:methyl-accepting chemotaxis protein
MLKNISIAKKLPMLFAAVTTVSVAIVGVMSYVQMSNTIENDAIAKVIAVEETMGHALDDQFHLIDADLRVLGNFNQTRDALVRLNAGFENLRKEGENPSRYLQDAYLTNSQYPIGQRHLADKADDKSYYTKFHEKYHDVFRRFMLEYDYYDVFLINNQGDVVYSVYKENDFAMNVSGPGLNGSGLHKAFEAALLNGVSFTDFSPYAPSAGDLAAFGAIGVKDKFGENIGVLAVQLKPDTFSKILSDDGGFSFDTKAFILGPDYRIRFAQGVKPDDLEANPEFFIGTEFSTQLASKNKGFAIVPKPGSGERMMMVFDKHKHHETEFTLVWEISYDDAMSSLTRLRNNLLLVAVITIALVTGFGLLIARSISGPLQNLQKGLQRFVATGELAIRVGTDAKDEVGSSTRAVDEIMAMTQRSMTSIADGNNTANEASTKMMNAAKVMAANAETQASSVEETESQVNSNAASAREANDLVVGTSGIVSDGKEKITRMVDSMDRIKQSSADIAKIIKVIDEIAFQTNLLALNAAVEAARAGQHGRGFAVVAAEVRNLAGRSAKAAQETSELIVGSSKRVEAGVEVSNQAREAFDKIADDIAQVTDLVGKITLASDEQARGVTYINRAIQEISDAAMTNAVRAEELTVVANELSTSTDGVSHQIARFNLGNPGSGRRSPIASAPAAAPEPVAPANNAPVPNGAMMNGSSSSGLDVDERGFGRY